jgi:heme oxygenase (biliverdin-IX-beta and delta-forming)
VSTAAPDPTTLAAEARVFLARFRTLLMATVSADGTPEASYAPFVRPDDNCFYVYVSGLSRHTSNLDATGRVSVLFIEDERDVKQLFARTRLTFDCRAELIERESKRWQAIMEMFQDTFGNVVELIRPLTDFKLFRLRPQKGIYVRGFAQAYRVSDAAIADIEHIRDATGNTKPA